MYFLNGAIMGVWRDCQNLTHVRWAAIKTRLEKLPKQTALYFDHFFHFVVIANTRSCVWKGGQVHLLRNAQPWKAGSLLAEYPSRPWAQLYTSVSTPVYWVPTMSKAQCQVATKEVPRMRVWNRLSLEKDVFRSLPIKVFLQDLLLPEDRNLFCFKLFSKLL